MRFLDFLEVDKDEVLIEFDEYFLIKFMYEVVDNSSNWVVCGKSCGVIFMLVVVWVIYRVYMEVMLFFVGYFFLFDVRLFKYFFYYFVYFF